MSSKHHYEERMEADLDEIRRKLRKVSTLVEDQVKGAVDALLTLDVDAANQVILGDKQVNRRIEDIDALVHAFIIRHAPSAGHLRFASGVLRLNVALERIGDYAGTIGREVAQLKGQPPSSVKNDLEALGQQARQTLGQALSAFHAEDATEAKKTYGLDRQLDHTLRAVLAELIDVGERREHALRDVFGLLRVGVILRRVAGQAANVAEQTVFWLTGERRDQRIFRILFVGSRNDRASQIAEAYARKAYPESGIYASCGVDPADTLEPGLIEFMDSRGLDARSSRATELTSVDDQARHYHVIVCLDPGVRDVITDVPFRTVVLDWSLDLPDGFSDEVLEEVYQEVVVRVQNLITTLAGPDAR